MNTVKWTIAIAAVAACAASASAAPIKVKFSSPSPPKAHLNVQVFGPWTKEVTAASGGTLEVKLVAGPVLANHRNIYDRVRQKVAGIGWGLQALVPGQFPGSNIVGLPATYNTSYEGSMALWGLYTKGLIAKEYADVKLLAAFAFPPSGVHANVPIKRLDDLKGMKLAASGRMRSQVVSILGAVPISLSPPQTYQSVSRGLVKGMIMTWTAFQPYRYAEVVNYHIDTSLGGSAGMIFMNKQVYEGLPAKAKQAIDSHSGEVLVRRFSKFWDRIVERARKRVNGLKGHTVTVLSPEAKQRWDKVVAPMSAAWVKRVPNGAEMLETFKAGVAKVRATN